MDSALKILVVEKDRDRAKDITDALIEGGWADVTVVEGAAEIGRATAASDADIVLIDIAHPDRDTLEHLCLVSDAKSRPVAMFVDRTDTDLSQAAVAAGLSAYVVDGLQKNRIKAVLLIAIARFDMMKKLQSELDAAKRALADRKVIDRAKGLLMQARGINEDEAYVLLRKAAMDQGRKVIEIARALVTSADLLR